MQMYVAYADGSISKIDVAEYRPDEGGLCVLSHNNTGVYIRTRLYCIAPSEEEARNAIQEELGQCPFGESRFIPAVCKTLLQVTEASHFSKELTKFEGLINRIFEWGKSRNLTTNEKMLPQATKVAEEATEVYAAAALFDEASRLLKSREDADRKTNLPWLRDQALEELIDGIGDTLVTLILQASLVGWFTERRLDPVGHLSRCLEYAYDKIRDRSGRLVNGVFVKDDKHKEPVISEAYKPALLCAKVKLSPRQNDGLDVYHLTPLETPGQTSEERFPGNNYYGATVAIKEEE